MRWPPWRPTRAADDEMEAVDRQLCDAVNELHRAVKTLRRYDTTMRWVLGKPTENGGGPDGQPAH